MSEIEPAPVWLRASTSLWHNFLGHAPTGYKWTIVGFLAANPLLLTTCGSQVAAWAIVLEFIFTLAMSLRCYPLQPGGLLAVEAIAMGLASPSAAYAVAHENFGVILLLMFMVAGISFLRELLMFLFTHLLVRVRSNTVLAVLFCSSSAVLSAFLDALTVTAVIVTVASGFYGIYHRVASGRHADEKHDWFDDSLLHPTHREELTRLRAHLRGLLMHAAVGTALGGVATLVGEPQNVLIGQIAGWHFIAFFWQMAPVSIPVIAAGLLTCVLLERIRAFGYGEPLPESVRKVLVDSTERQDTSRTPQAYARLWTQAAVAVALVLGLALHVAEVGLLGLAVIVLVSALCGVIEEKRLGHAFEEAMPFTALLVTFFAIVAVIHEQHLFAPIVDAVLAQNGKLQLGLMFLASGAVSAISDNVFVATVYITEVKAAWTAGQITRDQFDLLAVAVNTGTNLPSVATPNGQAAFLFLLTSSLAPLIRLGYGRMVWMALPYTLVLTSVGLAATIALR